MCLSLSYAPAEFALLSTLSKHLLYFSASGRKNAERGSGEQGTAGGPWVSATAILLSPALFALLISCSKFCSIFAFGKNAPGGSRTCNLRLRRPTLYPIELRARIVGGILAHSASGVQRTDLLSLFLPITAYTIVRSRIVPLTGEMGTFAAHACVDNSRMLAGRHVQFSPRLLSVLIHCVIVTNQSCR